MKWRMSLHECKKRGSRLVGESLVGLVRLIWYGLSSEVKGDI